MKRKTFFGALIAGITSLFVRPVLAKTSNGFNRYIYIVVTSINETLDRKESYYSYVLNDTMDSDVAHEIEHLCKLNLLKKQKPEYKYTIVTDMDLVPIVNSKEVIKKLKGGE